MDLLYSQACTRCIDRFIGPALHHTLESKGVSWCGGCGQTVEQYRFSYWYPLPEEATS